MTPRERATGILTSIGAQIVRHKKHEIWQLPGGRTWTRSKTPSDSHSDLNNLSDLKRELGVHEVRVKNPERKEKHPEHGGNGKQRSFTPTIDSTLANQLRSTGIIEKQLREHIAELENSLLQMTASREKWRGLYEGLGAETERSWLWRLRCWVRGKRKAEG